MAEVKVSTVLADMPESKGCELELVELAKLLIPIEFPR